jgi:hypothetical protein
MLAKLVRGPLAEDATQPPRRVVGEVLDGFIAEIGVARVVVDRAGASPQRVVGELAKDSPGRAVGLATADLDQAVLRIIPEMLKDDVGGLVCGRGEGGGGEESEGWGGGKPD